MESENVTRIVTVLEMLKQHYFLIPLDQLYLRSE